MTKLVRCYVVAKCLDPDRRADREGCFFFCFFTRVAVEENVADFSAALLPVKGFSFRSATQTCRSQPFVMSQRTPHSYLSVGVPGNDLQHGVFCLLKRPASHHMWRVAKTHKTFC